MNIRKLLVSVLMLVSVLLAACQAQATSVPTAVPPTAAPTIAPPTDTATPALPPSDPNALATVAGTYKYKSKGYGYAHFWLRSDGTYATPAGFGVFTVTPDQITFVDTVPASAAQCSSDPGVYKWSLDNNKLTLVPVQDNCEQRATFFGGNINKVQDDTNSPVELIWQITGSPNDFLRSSQIAVDGQSNIYVVDGGNQRIQKFDANGKLLTMWGTQGDRDGQFMFRVGSAHFGAVAVDGAGNVYVTDWNSRVQKFDSNGKFLMKWGSPGSGNGQFASHSQMFIAVDTLGNVYVTEGGNYRIQKFDSNGKFLLKWGGKGNGDGEFGDGPDFSGPAGIAVDSRGNVYVADSGNYRIEKFDASGNFLSQWGSKGTGDGQFLNAACVAVDQQGNIYVTDNQQNVGGDTNQVSKFDSNGKFLLKWGSTGKEIGMLYYAGAIAVDKQGNIYVVSQENVQKFRPK